ncbi:hypothetical protein FHT76_007713 [Rhizobium sp. BK176]|nr:hypothetical protein [Rhizobium sp. BK181]MBB3545138.1 hypothetical protein [Rhizobium sp. BK399]MCS3743896.1 hypothetical protein [Rhizobium sp. BK661]MCS4095992.1 hypothetical protein [Rhizobium sp. BK176]
MKHVVPRRPVDVRPLCPTYDEEAGPASQTSDYLSGLQLFRGQNDADQGLPVLAPGGREALQIPLPGTNRSTSGPEYERFVTAVRARGYRFPQPESHYPGHAPLPSQPVTSNDVDVSN